LSTFGRRGSRESGWNWSRPPAGPGRPPPSPPPLLPLAGAVLLFAAIAASLLAVWLSDSDSATTPPTATPVATATPTPTREPSPTPSPTQSPEPSPAPSPTSSPQPSPTPTAVIEPDFSLAVWDRSAWLSEPDGQPPPAFREGQVVPFMLRIGDARPGIAYALIRYTCKTLQFLSGFDRDSGSEPALAPGGPPSALPDSTAVLPDDPATPADDSEHGRLSLWGGSFGPVELVAVTPPGECERSVNVKLVAERDDLFLLWGAAIAPGAGGGKFPVRVTVTTRRGERSIEIDPASIVPAP